MVCRSTVEEKILDVAKGKMVLEHLVVATMGGGPEGREGGARRRDGAQEQSAMDEILMYGAKSLFEEDAAGAGPAHLLNCRTAADTFLNSPCQLQFPKVIQCFCSQTLPKRLLDFSCENLSVLSCQSSA